MVFVSVVMKRMSCAAGRPRGVINQWRHAAMGTGSSPLLRPWAGRARAAAPRGGNRLILTNFAPTTAVPLYSILPPCQPCPIPPESPPPLQLHPARPASAPAIKGTDSTGWARPVSRCDVAESLVEVRNPVAASPLASSPLPFESPFRPHPSIPSHSIRRRLCPPVYVFYNHGRAESRRATCLALGHRAAQ